jgi:hypothetical protein
MKLNELLAAIEPFGAKIAGREVGPDGDGWTLWIGRLSEMVYPFAFLNCIEIHVEHLDNPQLHPEVTDAVLRRFRRTDKKAPGKEI